MLPKAEWNVPTFYLLQLSQRPPKRASRTPVKKHGMKTIKQSLLHAQFMENNYVKGVYLLERIEGDLEAVSGLLRTNLCGPVDVLKNKLDRFAAPASSTVDDVTLLVRDDGGSGRACGL